jgi:hypothetical protein
MVTGFSFEWGCGWYFVSCWDVDGLVESRMRVLVRHLWMLASIMEGRERASEHGLGGG